MRNDAASFEPAHLYYYVIFHAPQPDQPYSPIIHTPFSESLVPVGGLHGLDPGLHAVLPALSYCLQLPRHGFDALDMPAGQTASGVFVPHPIMLLPDYAVLSPKMAPVLRNRPPALVISEDICHETGQALAVRTGAFLGSVRLSDLSSQLLQQHWERIGAQMQSLPLPDSPLPVAPQLLPDEAVPLLFLANQLRASDQLVRRLEDDSFSISSQMGMAIRLRGLLDAMVEMEKKGAFDPSPDELDEATRRHSASVRVPLVLTLPGTAARQRPKGKGVEPVAVNPAEQKAVDIIGLHAAAARSGVRLDGATLPTDVFAKLDRLERSAISAKQKNHFVWKTMSAIGKQLAKHLGPDGVAALRRASHIVAFTDFPIGLGILPGDDDPLCCITPISYRPLTPLTRTLQIEVSDVGELYIGRGFKVVVAECLSQTDRIRPFSDAGWQMVRDMFAGDKRVEFVYRDIQSVQALKDLLHEHGDASILVISAHGRYAADANAAGLAIGDEIWMGDDDDLHPPPVVILSACHVSPRGVGAVTVTDLMLRAGARAVLGTLIPVDVRRNSLLVARLFTYIAEALEGRGHYRTLADAWAFVVGSNAVNEIVASPEKLAVWAHYRPKGRVSPVEEFMLSRSVGRLRRGHIYADTVTVLREIAAENGMQGYLNSILSSQGIFPESCFYVWTGSPEHVLLTEPIIEKLIDRGGQA